MKSFQGAMVSISISPFALYRRVIYPSWYFDRAKTVAIGMFYSYSLEKGIISIAR